MVSWTIILGNFVWTTVMQLHMINKLLLLLLIIKEGGGVDFLRMFSILTLWAWAHWIQWLYLRLWLMVSLIINIYAEVAFFVRLQPMEYGVDFIAHCHCHMEATKYSDVMRIVFWYTSLTNIVINKRRSKPNS